MSINTITPTFNNHIPSSEVDRIKAASEYKNQGDNLTHANTGLNSSHGAAFQSVSNIKSDTEIKKAAVEVDSADYFDELLKGIH
jgi:hypothetical protein